MIFRLHHLFCYSTVASHAIEREGGLRTLRRFAALFSCSGIAPKLFAKLEPLPTTISAPLALLQISCTPGDDSFLHRSSQEPNFLFPFALIPPATNRMGNPSVEGLTGTYVMSATLTEKYTLPSPVSNTLPMLLCIVDF